MNNRREFLKRIALLGAAATLPIHNLLAENVETNPSDTDGLFTVSHGKEILRKKSPRTITIPDVGEYKVLKGDFHYAV